jgi:Ca2+/H+ antiporter
MKGQENPAELLVMCVVVIVLSILGVVAAFSRGLFGTLDGLLILFVSLMMILIFGLLLFFQLKQQRRRDKNQGDSDSAPAATGK